MVVVGEEVRLHPLPTSVVGLVCNLYLLSSGGRICGGFGFGGHCGVGFEYDGRGGGGGTGMARRWTPFATIAYQLVFVWFDLQSLPFD